MLTLKEDSYSGFIEVEKSKFFSYAFKADKEEQVKQILKDLEEKNRDDRHICYAYNLKNGKCGASEDKEPTSSFHKLLSLLLDKKIEDVLIVVIRYFGGTLLGAGPLDRLYFKQGTELIKEDNLRPFMTFYFYKGELRTSYFKRVKDLIDSNGKLTQSEFKGQLVEVEFYLKDDKSEAFSYFIDCKLIKKEEK